MTAPLNLLFACAKRVIQDNRKGQNLVLKCETKCGIRLITSSLNSDPFKSERIAGIKLH